MLWSWARSAIMVGVRLGVVRGVDCGVWGVVDSGVCSLRCW